MLWKLPPKIKIYEALGSIADNRISVSDNSGEVYSSTRNKKYIVKYDPENNAIMANDNASYWAGYLGYPAIAFLLVKGIMDYNPKFANALKDIPWKDINQKFRNNHQKVEKYVKETVANKNTSVEELEREVERIYDQIKQLGLEKLGKRISPPKGY
ncbi:MAG: hypothetical protein ACP5EQ_03870 [Candidatus Cloacimonadia bacterium]